ncbi:uncharacterized protein LOC100679606 [Nasonia vitripennis]|uniref:Cadherin domain-containing protein n=1 Tax=Nasonia vitripennis TaxID=7425 RepID=A0A7M7GG33_NASVI|nr:uncharacterized protein LOC100679606 [Nasonia vitripennis]
MKLLFWSFAALYIFTLLISGGQSEKDEKPNCVIFHKNGEAFSDADWDRGIEIDQIDDITPAGTKIKSFKTENITSVYTSSVNGKYSYLRVLESEGKDEDEFYIQIDDGFSKYEEYETEEKMTLSIEFECSKDYSYRNIDIRIPIRDTNNHSPKCLQWAYEYKVPMPLPKNFVFDTINQIAARDVDLTNKAIDFAIKGHDRYNTAFLITGLEPTKEDKKNYPARFETSMTIDFKEDTRFILTATDSEEPRRTKASSINFVIDKANSFPRFAEPVYVADLTHLKYDKPDKILLRFLGDKNITLDGGYERPVNFSLTDLSEENKKHFEVTGSGPYVYIEMNGLTDKFFNQVAISAVLTATKETARAHTAILVVLPEVSDKTEESTESVRKSSTEDDSANGYMVSTIILSLTSVGLLGYVIYFHLYRR